MRKPRISTESAMTQVPIYENTNRTALKNQSREQIINGSIDKPISRAHKTYDTDLARDNLENDNTAADLQDL